MDQKPALSKKLIENSLIQHSSFVFHSFFNRNMDDFLKLLSPDFVWIGSSSTQYTKGIPEFMKIISKKQKGIPTQISNEDYHILTHNHSLWIVYGNFNATIWIDETSYFPTQHRATFVWRYTKDGPRLLHLHCTPAQDIPLEEMNKIRKKKALDVRWYEYMQDVNLKENARKKRILLRDIDGKIHYLMPSEILYVQMNYRIAIVHTTNTSFETHKTIQQLMNELPFLLQTHKSWLVNPIYVFTFQRYEVLLTSGQNIPIGKPRYNEVRDKLENIAI